MQTEIDRSDKHACRTNGIQRTNDEKIQTFHEPHEKHEGRASRFKGTC